MKIVGLTGGIGSGKSTVAKMFLALGVPVYIADDEAKKLMNRSKVIQRKLIALFGGEAYKNGMLNRPYLANLIFNNKGLLQQMNGIVHPKVAKHFENWVKKQQAPYVIKEVAILFENSGHTKCDYTITVTAPKALRIERLLQRDSTTVAKIEAIIKNQLPDKVKIRMSDFVIKNTSLNDTERQVHNIHYSLLQISSKNHKKPFC